MREEGKLKRQFCEDAVIHQEEVDRFEFECNTKETQTECLDADFQIESTIAKVDFGVQCCIEEINSHQPFILSETEESNDEESEFESDYVHNIDDSDNELDEFISPTPSKAAFIVYWTSLLVLLRKCLLQTCILPAKISNIVTKGPQLILNLRCTESHGIVWKSQPNVKHYSVGNLTCAASVLFSANTYQRLFRYFDIAGIQWITKTSFYAIYKNAFFIESL